MADGELRDYPGSPGEIPGLEAPPDDEWDQDLGSLYILEESPPPPLPTTLPSERRHLDVMPAYNRPLDDPRHRCVQGLCDDHA
jgi:hypothetical protein